MNDHGPAMALCSKCNSRPRHKHYSWCKECHQEGTNRRKAIRRHEYRDKVQLIKLEAGCVVCGYKEHPEALQFDHLPEFEKVKDVGKLVAEPAGWQRILDEINKCEVVCANCHAVRTAQRRNT